jgi:hypothetical protein
MIEARRRRLTLLDLMMLVVAAALGVAMARQLRLTQRVAYLGAGWSPSWLDDASLILLTTTLVVLILRLRTPRAPLRRLARCPGFLVLLAASASAILCTLEHLPALLRPRSAPPKVSHELDIFNYLSMVADSSTVGGIIALVWTIGLLHGLRWRHPDWVEWLGRGLGAAWVGSWLIQLVLSFFG